jgi:hypothetical protein
MKLLIAVISCWLNEASTDAVRKTWANNSPLPVKFFLGQPTLRRALSDEIVLNVPDDYEHLVAKVKAAMVWARANGYTSVFKCDDDCYVSPSRLLRSGLSENSGHVGMHATQTRVVPGDLTLPKGFLHGGAGYFVGRRALDVLCSAPVNGLSEDGWATHHIMQAGLTSTGDCRFKYTRRVFGTPLPPVPTPENLLIAGGELHTLVGGRSEMYCVHRRMTNEN